jgi:hypothetical protein
VLVLAACGSSAVRPAAEATTPQSAADVQPEVGGNQMTFGDDLTFLQQHGQPVLLQDQAGKAQVIVSPDYQGRVMTSTALGVHGASFGWINRAFIAKGERVPHMNVFGGEDRFWLGPEGGQYGLYFPPGAPFDLEHWQVPEGIDWGAWTVNATTRDSVQLTKEMKVQNYGGYNFDVRIERTVRILEPKQVADALSVKLPGDVAVVGYESQSSLYNTGKVSWAKSTGLLSIWILGQFNPSPTTTIVIPFVPGSEGSLGKVVNDAYFGKVPPDRLVVKDDVLFFRGDGQQRGKIGIPRPRAKPTVGAYDAAGKVLTIVQYTLPEDARDYVNSMWEQQAQPYGGDVVNSYNDGPPEPGKAPLGPFWELETSSRAASLAPTESLVHVHRTMHLTGERKSLDAIAKSVLGVGLDEIEHAFAK